MDLTWIEISKQALLNNISQIKNHLSAQVKFMGVVKSDAYGHGLLGVVNEIKSEVDYLAVYDFKDALLLRCKNITKPILTLGRVFPEQIQTAIKNKIELSVSNFDILEAAQKIAGEEKLIIHLCIDTGMGRDGFVASDMEDILQILPNRNIIVAGLYTHFAAADDSSFNAYSKKQIDELMRWEASLNEMGIKPLIHASATVGTFIPDLKTHFDMVRIGGGLYGFWSSKEASSLNQNRVELKPVLSWKCLIVETKNLPKGSHISYGCTFTLKRDSKIAILPIGYFDGIPRISSGKSQVLIDGMKVKQIGRVTMNMIIIDVTDIETVKNGDIATIIGSDEKSTISAEDWGDWSESLNYEITTRINANLPRKITS